MPQARLLTTPELEAGLDVIRQSPRDQGTLAMIVRRPRVGEREELQAGELDLAHGLVGDNWRIRGDSNPSGPNPETQLNVMNARVIALLAQERDRWPLAGDQLYLDLDLSVENLPVGARLSLGSAVIEVTPQPHNGCKKFVSRFGQEAMLFVNSELGKRLRLRGLNAKVAQPGIIRVGDVIRKI